MLVRLHVIRGKANKDSVTLTLPAVIGRSREADLTIIHPMISRRHCELVEDNGLVKIRDLGSLNGTYVGGEQISEAFLPPGSVFSIGPLTFRIEYDTSPAAISREPSVVQPEVSPPTDLVVEQEAAALPGSGIGSEPATEPQPLPDTPGALAEPIEPRIAPPDGALPDFGTYSTGVGIVSQRPAPGASSAPSAEEAEAEAPCRLGEQAAPRSTADRESHNQAWSDVPPPFTTVVTNSDSEALDPLILNGGSGDLGSGVPPAAPTTGVTTPVAPPSGVPHNTGKPRGWWPFRR